MEWKHNILFLFSLLSLLLVCIDVELMRNKKIKKNQQIQIIFDLFILLFFFKCIYKYLTMYNI